MLELEKYVIFDSLSSVDSHFIAERCFLSNTHLHSRENVVKILQQSLLNWRQLNSGKFCALTAVNGWDGQERMTCRSTTGCQTDSGRTDWRLTMYGQNGKHSTTDKYMDWQICFSCVYHLPALKSPKYCNQVFKSVTLGKFIALDNRRTDRLSYCCEIKHKLKMSLKYCSNFF